MFKTENQLRFFRCSGGCTVTEGMVFLSR